MEKAIYHANSSHERAWVDISISDKRDLRQKIFTRGKEEHFIMIKGMIHQQAITIKKIHAPKTKVQIRKVKSNRTARRNRQIYSYS